MLRGPPRGPGYATAAIGKWHLVPEREDTPSRPLRPLAPPIRASTTSDGFLNGETDQCSIPSSSSAPSPSRWSHPPTANPDYTLNEELADKASPDPRAEVRPHPPLLPGHAPGASQPLQAPACDRKIPKAFDMAGTPLPRDRPRPPEEPSGVVPQDTKPAPRPAESPAWTPSPPPVQGSRPFPGGLRRLSPPRANHELGQHIDAIAATGQLDNTLILYIAGDNGASLEGGLAELSNAANGPDHRSHRNPSRHASCNRPAQAP